MSSFQLRPLNPREAEYHPKGSMELIRRYSAQATPQVWVVTPDDMEALKIVLEVSP